MSFRSSEGARRAATALLWANGGFEVALRMPDLAAAGSDAEQLGLASPAFQDFSTGPAAWHRSGADEVLLLSAEALLPLLGTQDFAAGEALLQSVVGIAVGGVLYRVMKCAPLLVGGLPCAYAVTLLPPAWT